MNSPFPGMDPYLEHPNRFPDFHNQFLTDLRALIQQALPRDYLARTACRTWLEISERSIEPNISVFHPQGFRRASNPNGPGRSAGQPDAASRLERDRALPVAPPRAPIIPTDLEEREEILLEIRLGRGDETRVVTCIELLSSGNKSFGSAARKSYLQKQTEVLNSRAHLVELDFLRGGAWTTAVSEERAREFGGEFDYDISIHRWYCRGEFVLYLIRLEQSLPEIGIPLLPEHGEVRVDLQEAFARSYAAAAYDREIRYDTDEPEPPLPDDRREWAQDVICAALQLVP